MQLTPDKAAGRSLGWADKLNSPRGTRGTCPADDTFLPRKGKIFNKLHFSCKNGTNTTSPPISVIFRREVAGFCDFFAIFAEKYKKMKKLCFISMMCLLALFVVSLAGCKKEEVNNNGNNNDNGGSGGGVNAQTDYVDLGLPSGTKWRYTNEYPPVFGEMYFTYDEAVSSFGDKLPTKEQFEELKDNCTWEWQGNDGYKVTGPNGNSIVLYDLGYRNCEGFVINVSAGYYWSYTPNGSDDAWGLYFNSGVVNVGCDHRCSGFTVRLVQD